MHPCTLNVAVDDCIGGLNRADPYDPATTKCSSVRFMRKFYNFFIDLQIQMSAVEGVSKMPFVRFICDLNERICPISACDYEIQSLLTDDGFLFREEVVLYLQISSISERRPDEGTMVKMILQLDEFCKQRELGIRGELITQ